MITVNELKLLPFSKGSVVTLGKFDGVHKGHSLLLSRVREISKEREIPSLVFTFDVPPDRENTSEAGTVIFTNRERRRILEGEGIDWLLECPFTPEVKSMTPEAFVNKVLKYRLNCRFLVVGDDFHFGKDRAGTPEVLKQLGTEAGMETEILPKLFHGTREISSTGIREEIRNGRIGEANILMGRNYFISGETVHGRHLGSTIGFPTANILPEKQKLLPPFGVYLTRVRLEKGCCYGVTNVGVCPTVDGRKLSVETHLFGCNGDLYGKFLTVEFLSYLRPELKFASVTELKAQIGRDKNRALDMISGFREKGKES